MFNKRPLSLQIFHSWSLGTTEEIINQEDLKLQNYVWDESSLRSLFKKESDLLILCLYEEKKNNYGNELLPLQTTWVIFFPGVQYLSTNSVLVISNIFLQVSRPKSSRVFWKVCVVGKHNGEEFCLSLFMWFFKFGREVLLPFTISKSFCSYLNPIFKGM